MAKRAFTIDTGKEQIEVEGHVPRNVAVKYLMKRRRSLLSTKDPEKVEKMFDELPRDVAVKYLMKRRRSSLVINDPKVKIGDKPTGDVKVAGMEVTKTFKVSWEKKGTGEFQGARFTFEITEANET
jgi:hypothetical protein